MSIDFFVDVVAVVEVHVLVVIFFNLSRMQNWCKPTAIESELWCFKAEFNYNFQNFVFDFGWI